MCRFFFLSFYRFAITHKQHLICCEINDLSFLCFILCIVCLFLFIDLLLLLFSSKYRRNWYLYNHVCLFSSFYFFYTYFFFFSFLFCFLFINLNPDFITGLALQTGNGFVRFATFAYFSQYLQFYFNFSFFTTSQLQLLHNLSPPMRPIKTRKLKQNKQTNRKL